jgi:hypothetical protein
MLSAIGSLHDGFKNDFHQAVWRENFKSISGQECYVILHVFVMFTPKSIAINDRHAGKARNFHQCYDHITELVSWINARISFMIVP